MRYFKPNSAEFSLFLQARLEVYRKKAKNLPSLGDPMIDWEETVYLNLILQQVSFKMVSIIAIHGVTEKKQPYLVTIY